MDRLISLQAAIDVVDKYDFEFPQYMEKFVTELRDAMKADLKCDIANLPSAQPEPQWIPCSKPPETDENVFIARGNENFMSCCIGHYDLDAETWYEDRNWFAKILYDALYWCKIPTLP